MGDETIIPCQYEALPDDVIPGDRILMYDGACELRVLSIEGGDVRCTVLSGGPVGDHKGINLPGTAVSAPSLTDKDRIDTAFALEMEVDFLALSFVRTGADISMVRETWTDARDMENGWVAIKDILAAPLAMCQDVGWMVVNNDEKVIIMRSWCEDDNEEHQEGGGATAIPKSWVKKIEYLEVGRHEDL